MRWYEESAKWVDATIKTAAAENAENAARISEWTTKWREIWVAALKPAAAAALGDKADAALEAVTAAFNTKAGKLGLKL